MGAVIQLLHHTRNQFFVSDPKKFGCFVRLKMPFVDEETRNIKYSECYLHPNINGKRESFILKMFDEHMSCIFINYHIADYLGS